MIAQSSDFDCFETSNLCVVASNLEVKLVTHTAGAFKIDEKIFRFDLKFKADPDKFYHAKLAAVRFSTYFLLAVSSTLEL